METTSVDPIQKLSPKKILKIMKDRQKSAKAVNRVYTSDQYMDGFTRKMYRNKLAYYQNGMRIKDKETIQRINSRSLTKPTI